MLNRDQLFPYLLRESTNPNSPTIGHGLVVQLCADTESDGSIVQSPVGEEELRTAGLSADEARRIAIENLGRFADDSPDLSIQVLGGPNEPFHFLLYSDHPRASACLLLPDLYEHASEVLHETDLLACAPQRESLVVFPKRDRAGRELLIEKLKTIEADAGQPLTFDLFQLAPGSVVPFTE
jgi:hypothetical protein